MNNYPAHYLIPNVDMSKVVLKSGADKRDHNRSASRQKRPQSANPGSHQQTANFNNNQNHNHNHNHNQNQPGFQNTKVIANINQNRVGSPKNQVKNPLEKTNYHNQSTKMSLGGTLNHQVASQN